MCIWPAYDCCSSHTSILRQSLRVTNLEVEAFCFKRKMKSQRREMRDYWSYWVNRVNGSVKGKIIAEYDS